MTLVDVVVVGGGAAGLMCAIEAGKRGRSVVVLEHNAKAGEKIRISGGGRCNFTNVNADGRQFLSENPKFALSALRRFQPRAIMALVDRYGIDWHEKTLGQLFCDGSSQQIIDMLLAELRAAGGTLKTGVEVTDVSRTDQGFEVQTSDGPYLARSLVVACGGKSIPKMGATGLGYKLAEQFGLGLVETRPGLVPFTFDPDFLEWSKSLAGVSLNTKVSRGKVSFEEAMLFTHRGLSGPAILQISSFWQPGDAIVIDLLPGQDGFELLRAARASDGKRDVHTVLGQQLPAALAQAIAGSLGRLGDQNDKTLRALGERINRWQVKPTGTEGYRTAEVTLGGVSTSDLDARTLEAKNVPGLYFVGEVVDVTGWLGGYNFQWAWASGWAAGQVA